MVGKHPTSLGERMSHAARTLQQQADPQSTMDCAVALAVENVPGCDGASISLVHGRRRIDTPACSDESSLRADQLQYELGEGPCLDAIHETDLVHSPRLSEEKRWPTWGIRVEAETAFRSIFAFRLFTHDNIVGAINMYSRSPGAFDAEDRDDGLALAAHIAVAVAAAQEVHHSRVGLESRTVIGQATGMLMERYGMEADRAFAVLNRYSQDRNVKLRAVAEEVVSTRQLPAPQDR